MSKINVNTVDTQCGSTLTLGSSGKTVTLASGASQSGFGRTGTVDWCTTAKTSPFTAVSGDGFFVNTTSGAITVTLPASPSAGDIVALKDYGGTWQTNNVTLARNGSKINGQCACGTLNTEAQSVTLIYVDGTKGWQDIHDSTADVTGQAFVAATGGTETTSGDYKIHTFTADGCFQVTNAGNSAGSNKISYLVVAGGGGGAGNVGNYDGSAGAGAGGYREGKCSSDPYTASPLDAGDGLTASVATFPITVGGGGSGGPATGAGSNGSNSVFSTITSTGGGGGNFPTGTTPTCGAGGSGSGAAATSNQPQGTAGAGNTPPVSPPQGNPGGNFQSSGASAAGGGGGAGAVGGIAPSNTVAGDGGAGATSSINGSPVQRAGGGGGSAYPANTGGSGGAGGGGDGGRAPGTPGPAGQAGTANTGGGGGGSNANPGNPSTGGAGGSGIVILRYKFQ